MRATERSSATAAIEMRELVNHGRADEAVRRLGQFTEVDFRETPDLEVEAARALARTGHFERAMARATAALWEFRAKRDLRGQMRANLVLGGIAFEQGHPHAAEHHLGLVRVLAVALDDRQVQSQVTNNLACLALQKGDFDAADALLQSALNLARDLADLRAQAEVFHNLNVVYRGKGQFEAAQEAGQQALVLGESLQDWSMVALALGGLVETGAWIDHATDLESLLDRAESSAQRANDPIRETEIRRVRTVLALKRKQNDEALRLAKEAHEMARRCGSDLLTAQCTGLMAIACKRLGLEAEAIRLHEEASVALYRLRAYLESEWFEREWA